DRLGVDTVRAELHVDHARHALTTLRSGQTGSAGRLREHRPLLEDGPGVTQHAVDGDLRGRGDVLGALTGADAGLDVARGEVHVHPAARGGTDARLARSRGALAFRLRRLPAFGNLHGRRDPLVVRQRQQTPQLVGEHQRMTVL